jgi:transglutaminase-like putative cysteine protease
MFHSARASVRRYLGDVLPGYAGARPGKAAAVAVKPAPVPDRIALNWLLATGLLACGTLAFELPIWISAVFVLGVAWRYAIERFHVYRPGRIVRYALVALVVLGVYREFGGILGRDPGLALLIALLGLKLLELRSLRDAVVTLFLLYVVLLGALLFGQSLPVALWTVFTVTVSLAALARLHQPLPARTALRLAGGLLLKALPLTIILYLLFPRIGGTLWGLPTDAHRGLSGIPDEVRAGTIHEISLSPAVALRVDFAGSTRPPPRELYWRALVLTETDGKTWRRGNATDEVLHPQGAPVRYRVTLEPSNKRWLFALDMPVTAPEGAFLRPGFTLVRPAPVTERISYEVTSYPHYTTRALAPSERQRMLAQPRVSARVQAFADALRSEHAAPAARVQAVLAHIRRENFVYTLSPPPPGEDPVDRFLFETRRGFCEHYASAFATLMRAAGVPARVVIGYQGGEINPTGDYLIVRQADAHAWVEVELPERGWVRVDPTAAVAPERIELGIEAIRQLEARGLLPGALSAEMLARTLADQPWFRRLLRQTRLYWDYTNLAWYRFVVDYRRQHQEGLLHALGFDTIEWARVLLVLGGACVLVLLGYVMWSRRGPRPDPIQRRYARFCRKLARAGLVRAPHEGALAFAARAAAARPDLAAPIGAITARYIDLRYGQADRGAQRRDFDRAVAAFRTRVAKTG